MSHAAKAFEGCDRTYKPVFADPKPQKPEGIKFEGGGGRDMRSDIRDIRGIDGGYGYSSGPVGPHHSPFDAINYSELNFLIFNSLCSFSLDSHITIP